LNKNTLYITFDGLSDPLGQSQILPYLIGIAKQGEYHITILSCEKTDVLRIEKENIEKLLSQFSINWIYIPYDKEGNFLTRFLYVQKLARMAKKIVQLKKISLIHCRSYLASLIGLRFKKKYNIPFVFDMRGYWADERMDGNIWRRSNLLHNFFYHYFKSKEKQYIKKSDAIVSLTYAAYKDLSLRFTEKLIALKTVVIPCCTNTDYFNKEQIQNKNLLPTISENDFLIIYTGSIGTWYYTKEMIDCILVWKQKIPNIKLLILTRDIKELNLTLQNYTLQERSIIQFQSASYLDVPNYLALAKASLFFIKPAYSKIASSPTKMAECWSMNLPIITNSGIGDNDIYFKQNEGGILINSFTKESYEKACDEFLLQLKKEINYRKIALDHFDTKTAIQKYVQVYDRLSR
jgi:glycosyltransferase involved in cell wall biosynthesis